VAYHLVLMFQTHDWTILLHENLKQVSVHSASKNLTCCWLKCSDALQRVMRGLASSSCWLRTWDIRTAQHAEFSRTRSVYSPSRRCPILIPDQSRAFAAVHVLLTSATCCGTHSHSATRLGHSPRQTNGSTHNSQGCHYFFILKFKDFQGPSNFIFKDQFSTNV